MNEDRENYRDEDIIGAVDRFKRSLISGSTKYFDVSEFEGIVEQLLDEGDLQGSEIAAKQGIQIHPNAVPLQLKYAQVLINKGKYEKSLQYLHFAEKVDSTNPDVHLLKGSARMVMGNETEALLSFRKAIKYAGNEMDEILYHIGSSYIQVGEISKAIHYFEQTIKANATNEMALYDLGFFCDQTGKYKKSIKYYNSYLDIDPFNHTVWFNLGTVYNKSDKHKKAIEAYEFAMVLNDDFHMALFNIGNALANSEKFEEAIVKYQEYIKLEPENADAYCYIGECFLNLENHKESELHYKKALKINSKNDTAWFGLGLLSWIDQQFEDSIRHIKKAIKIDNLNAEFWLTLGKVNNDFNNQVSAINALKKAARIDAGNTEVWLTWVDVLTKHNEHNNAIRILKRGIKNNSDSILKYRLVALLLEDKKEKEAFEMLLISMKQDFEQINYLFDIFPKSTKNRKLKKLVDNFKKDNIDK
ncbi:MAG: tetratricopeptide repeat protein [Bacteroidetes bacterium]|nr:tetratricopeptide repeat protein [Bacteroidota bacterium]